MEIISVGTRLKQIRKALGIRQDEITGKKITRNLISLIEHDKVTLTPKVSVVLTTQINRIAKEKGIDLVLEPEDLLETEENQIKRYFERFLKALNLDQADMSQQETQMTLHELETLLGGYDLAELSFQLNVALEQYYERHLDYHKAMAHALKAYEKTIKMPKDDRVLTQLINLGYYGVLLKKYTETLYYCQVALNQFPKMPVEDTYRILFNKMIAYGESGDRLTALRICDKLIALDGLTARQRLRALINRADLLENLKRSDEAIAIYEQLLSEKNCGDEQYLIYGNLIDIHLKRAHKQALILTMDKAVRRWDSDPKRDQNPYGCNLNKYLALGYQSLEKESMFMRHIDMAIAIAVRQQNKRNLDEILKIKLNHMLQSPEEPVLLQTLRDMEQYVQNGLLSRNDPSIWSLMVYYANKTANIEWMNLVAQLAVD